MKEVKFDRNKARYDRFDRMWIERDSFLRFETGEVCYTNNSPYPADRRYYAEYGVTVFMPGDRHAPKLYTTDGHAVPMSQLDIGDGNPYLLWDQEHNMVVHLTRQSGNTTIPKGLRYTECYWAADDSKPVAGKVKYAPPNVLTPEQREFMKECKALVPTVIAMRQDNPELTRIAQTTVIPRQGAIQSAIEQGVPPIRFLEEYTLGRLDQLREGGVSWLLRTPIEVPYLVTK